MRAAVSSTLSSTPSAIAPRRDIHVLSVLTFFLLATAISWLLWLPLVLTSRGITTPTLPLHHYLGALGPAIAAFATTWMFEGRAGVLRMARALDPRRVHVGWLMVALLSPMALLLLAWLGMGAFAGAWTSLQGFALNDELVSLGALGALLFHVLTFGLGEELGWRGFVLPRLQATRSAWSATVLLTALWALWHAPAFLYRDGYAAMDGGAVVGWLISLFTGALILTWLFNSTRGSVLAVCLFHGAMDFVFTSRLASPMLQAVIGVFLTIAAIIIVNVCGAETLSCTAQTVTRDGERAARPRRREDLPTA